MVTSTRKLQPRQGKRSHTGKNSCGHPSTRPMLSSRATRNARTQTHFLSRSGALGAMTYGPWRSRHRCHRLFHFLIARLRKHADS